MAITCVSNKHSNVFGQWLIRDFWGYTIPCQIVAPATSLTSLTLHSNTVVGFIPEFHWPDVHFPDLAHLSLRHILFMSYWSQVGTRRGQKDQNGSGSHERVDNKGEERGICGSKNRGYQERGGGKKGGYYGGQKRRAENGKARTPRGRNSRVIRP